MADLTDRQATVLATIETFYSRHGCGPSIRHLGNELGISVATAHQHVRALARKGLVRYMGRLGYVPTKERIGANAVLAS